MLYRGSEDGWKWRDFHENCDKLGPTLTLFKTKTGTVCGGFTVIDWHSGSGYKPDKKAFIFNLTSKRVFLPHKNDNAIYCYHAGGPRFGGALGLGDEPMNKHNGGLCYVGPENCHYKVEEDGSGNSPVTGEGGNKGNNTKWFTCVEVEVY